MKPTENEVIAFLRQHGFAHVGSADRVLAGVMLQSFDTWRSGTFIVTLRGVHVGDDKGRTDVMLSIDWPMVKGFIEGGMVVPDELSDILRKTSIERELQAEGVYRADARAAMTALANNDATLEALANHAFNAADAMRAEAAKRAATSPDQSAVSMALDGEHMLIHRSVYESMKKQQFCPVGFSLIENTEVERLKKIEAVQNPPGHGYVSDLEWTRLKAIEKAAREFKAANDKYALAENLQSARDGWIAAKLELFRLIP